MVDVLIENKLALSVAEMKSTIKPHCDRITIYRNLKLLTKKGILHQVVVDGLVSKYVLPDSRVKLEISYSKHPHFRCMRCDQVKCFTQYTLEDMGLLQGYKMLGQILRFSEFVIYVKKIKQK